MQDILLKINVAYRALLTIPQAVAILLELTGQSMDRVKVSGQGVVYGCVGTKPPAGSLDFEAGTRGDHFPRVSGMA